MVQIPTRVDIESAERSAAAMARGLSGSSEAWGVLLSNAQAVLAARSDTPRSVIQDTYSFEDWKDLVATAKVLDLASSKMSLKDPENRQTAAILATYAFGMSGTAVSSSAVILGSDALESDLGPSELLALVLSSPMLIDQAVTHLPSASMHRVYIENLIAFLASGKNKQLNTVSDSLQELTYT